MDNNIPNHIAIIPDGNRRWARGRGLQPWEGHEAGAQNTENLMREALKLGITNISIWGSSLENLQKRPLAEKRALLRIYEQYFAKLIDSSDIHDNEVKMNFIGKWREQFPQSLKDVMEKCITATEKYSKRTLNFFLAYSGDDEMLEAVREIIKSDAKAEDVTFDTIKNNLMTRDLPAVDYLIRTGGEPHLSVGFMMWDIANAQLYFSEKFYPDFDVAQFGDAIEEYGRRQRRLGK